jgi:hypothetical protein
MDDEFYTIGSYIAHKSCVFNDGYFSNAKFMLTHYDINRLKQKCDLIDKINDNIDISIHNEYGKEPFKFPCVSINCLTSNISLCYVSKLNDQFVRFNSYEEFYDYMCEHHTHLIKSHDIKIALKD